MAGRLGNHHGPIDVLTSLPPAAAARDCLSTGTASGTAGTLGAVAYTLSRALRVIPRLLAIKFFLPKPDRSQRPTGMLLIGYMAITLLASKALFAVHSVVIRACSGNPSGTHCHQALCEVLAGCAGGAAYGTVTTFLPRRHVPISDFRARLGVLPVHVCKEAVGFGLFFSVHDALMRKCSVLLARIPAQAHAKPAELRPAAPGTFTSRSRHMALSTTAGGLAGAAYHTATYPIQRAWLLAVGGGCGAPAAVRGLPSSSDIWAVLRATLKYEGARGLYTGCLLSMAAPFLVGAVTF
eukprot:gene11583-2109_t